MNRDRSKRPRLPAYPGPAGRHSTIALLALSITLFLTASISDAFQPVPPAAADRKGTGDALVILQPDDIDALWRFVEDWEALGARFPHVYPPDLLIEVPLKGVGLLDLDQVKRCIQAGEDAARQFVPELTRLYEASRPNRLVRWWRSRVEREPPPADEPEEDDV